MNTHKTFLAGVRPAAGRLAEKGFAEELELHAVVEGIDLHGLCYVLERAAVRFCFFYSPHEGEQNCYVRKGEGAATLPLSNEWTPYRALVLALDEMTAEELGQRAAAEAARHVRLGFDETWAAMVDEIMENQGLILQRLG